MQNKTLMGKLILENGIEAVFFLSCSDVELLERDAQDIQEYYRELEKRTNRVFPRYNIADELVSAAIVPYLKALRKEAKQCIK